MKAFVVTVIDLTTKEYSITDTIHTCEGAAMQACLQWAVDHGGQDTHFSAVRLTDGCMLGGNGVKYTSRWGSCKMIVIAVQRNLI